MVWDQEWQDVDPGPGKSPRIGSKISQIWKDLLCDIASDFCTDWRTFETIDTSVSPDHSWTPYKFLARSEKNFLKIEELFKMGGASKFGSGPRRPGRPLGCRSRPRELKTHILRIFWKYLSIEKSYLLLIKTSEWPRNAVGAPRGT